MQLSEHFSLKEFTYSEIATRKGIDNTPNTEMLENLRMLALRLEGVRDVLSMPIHITSGYRSPKLNAAIGSKPTSSHVNGLAVDFICPSFGDPLEICHKLKEHWAEIEFDQLIYEGDWVHISCSDDHPRHEILTAHFMNGSVLYSRGLPDAC